MSSALFVQVEIDNRRDVPTHHYFHNPNSFFFREGQFSHIYIAEKEKTNLAKINKPQPQQLHINTNFVT